MADQSIPYCGPAPSPEALVTDWNLDPVVLIGLAVALWAGYLYASDRRAFLYGWAALVVAFVSPLCAATVALFSARALHHLILVSVAAPLLATAFRRQGLPLGFGLVAVSIPLVLWHLPNVYSLAWQSEGAYWALQFALLAGAISFWSRALDFSDMSTGSLLVRALMIAALAGVMGLIGAVLTFSRALLYPEHLTSPLIWGLEPIADQQLAGLVMWLPGLLPLAVIAARNLRFAWQRAEAGA